MRELDFGQVWLRLNVADEGEKDDVIAEWKGDAKAFLQTTLVLFYQSALSADKLTKLSLTRRDRKHSLFVIGMRRRRQPW